MTVIKDAVIVAAGLEWKNVTNQRLFGEGIVTLVDIPAIIHLIREVLDAGISRIHIIIPTKDFTPFIENKRRPSHLNQKLVNRFF